MVSLSVDCYAQHINEWSNEVIAEFKKANPTVQQVDWLYSDSNLIASFKEKNLSVEKTFAKSGKLIKTILQMDESFLPKASLDFVAKYYGSNKIERAYKVYDTLSKVCYLIEIYTYRLSFDYYGRFLKVEIFNNLK